jgi:hypothetical protein
MPRLLRIEDMRDHVFLYMPEVLKALSPEADSLRWSILDMREVTSKDDAELDEEDLLQLDRKVMASPTGLPMSFSGLQDLANNVRQVIDGLFVGCADDGHFPSRDSSDVQIVEQAAMVVAAVDSTFWLAAGPEPVLKRIGETFRGGRRGRPR